MKKLISIMAILLMAGCATTTSGTVATKLPAVVDTVQGLAYQLDNVYAYLVAQKAIPDRLQQATLALASLDAVAPMIKAGAEALQGDKFNWAAFAVQAAVIVAKVMGYIVPML
jgi:hypothetical protein